MRLEDRSFQQLHPCKFSKVLTKFQVKFSVITYPTATTFIIFFCSAMLPYFCFVAEKAMLTGVREVVKALNGVKNSNLTHTQ